MPQLPIGALTTSIVFLLGLAATLAYSYVVSRGDWARRCDVAYAITVSSAAVAAFWVNPLASLLVMPLLSLTVLIKSCNPWYLSTIIVAGEGFMNALYLEVLFSGLGELLRIVPEVQFGFWYRNNAFLNAIGVLSEGFNSLVFVLMLIITLLPIRSRLSKTTVASFMAAALINPGDWVDLPTLPVIALVIPPYKALGASVANFIVDAKLGTVYLNYLASVVVGFLILRRVSTGLSAGDAVALLSILAGAVGDLMYFYQLTMIPRFIAILLLSIIVLTIGLKGLGDVKVKHGEWALPLLTVSFLLYTASIIEAQYPASPLPPVLVMAIKSPYFLTPTIALAVVSVLA